MPEVEFGANTLHMPNRGWKEDKTSCSSEQHSLHTSPSSQQNGLNIVALVHHHSAVGEKDGTPRAVGA
eukprot:m.226139 g.226139  ORF g.226139 m.226139 type:complete len:68 (+) comp18789_c0_seq15:1527-1730(+)